MMLAGYQNKANILDLITISAFMTIGVTRYKDTRSNNKYKNTTVFEISDKELTYYNKFFIADDFIETIFIWEDFLDQLEIMKKKLSINHIKKWCLNNGLNYDGLLGVIAVRDSIIEYFIQSIGLNPFWNGIDVPRHTYNLRKIFQTNIYMGLEEVKKIKQCIYEGFRLNTATWDENKQNYILDNTHEKIILTSDIIHPLPAHSTFIQNRPKKIIVSNINLNENKFTKIYQQEADVVSVMDNFINIDDTFIIS